jgi:hypothetical protein
MLPEEIQVLARIVALKIAYAHKRLFIIYLLIRKINNGVPFNVLGKTI